MKSVNVCRLPCLGDQFTKQQVCYALRTCSLVFQKCDGCTSGTRVNIMLKGTVNVFPL